jgi:hypothetical protein
MNTILEQLKYTILGWVMQNLDKKLAFILMDPKKLIKLIKLSLLLTISNF